ncbi:MAG: heavy-metal-associated domain-containing protein [Clostridia bacterium]|nr:heavy-metal-associated domain-containing protein [Clostridia bacterium]
MEQITLKIDGMMCGMCEAHICDLVRRAFPNAKKVKASRKRGEATFLTDTAVDGDRLAAAFADTGYRLLSVTAAPPRLGFFR